MKLLFCIKAAEADMHDSCLLEASTQCLIKIFEYAHWFPCKILQLTATKQQMLQQYKEQMTVTNSNRHKEAQLPGNLCILVFAFLAKHNHT